MKNFLPLLASDPISECVVLSPHFELSFVEPITVALKRILVPQEQVVWPRTAY